MLQAFLLPLLLQVSVDPSKDTITIGSHAPAQGTYSAPREPLSPQKAQLEECMEQARKDPSTAIATASTWITRSSGAEQAYPQQCLGMAYTSLLRWQAAEQAFLAAHTAARADDYSYRARLAAMAGNSALADGRNDAALADLDLAIKDAAAGSDTVANGEIQIDRARALVAQGKTADAAAALAEARRDAPQNPDGWLLSATLARRSGDLGAAQAQIETAAGLDPKNPQVGLEAGVIAALAGRDDAARKSWQSVIDTSPGTPEADTANAYIAEVGGVPAAPPAAPENSR